MEQGNQEVKSWDLKITKKKNSDEINWKIQWEGFDMFQHSFG